MLKENQMRYSSVLDTFKGLLLPFIAIVTTYIAWQQWKINERKYKLDLYDRRLRIYREIIKTIGLVQRDADISTENLTIFLGEVSEADFLFDNEISLYIKELYSHGINLWRNNKDYRDDTQTKPEGYNHTKIAENINAEITWFTKQFNVSKDLFSKYLILSR